MSKFLYRKRSLIDPVLETGAPPLVLISDDHVTHIQSMPKTPQRASTHKKVTHKITPAERQRAWRAADPQRAAIQRERNRINMAAKRAAAKKQK